MAHTTQKLIIGSTFAVALCGLAGPSFAQDGSDFAQGYQAGYEEGADETVSKPLANLTLGGGVSTFVRSDVRDHTGTAGNWDLRASFGTSWPFAIEAAYIGSAQSIDAIGLDSDAVLLGNGVEGALKFQLPLVIQPYVTVGAAWTNYRIVNADTNTSDIADKDNVFEVPVGVGIGFHPYGMSVDLRGTYRHAFNNDLMGRGTDIDDVDGIEDIDSDRGDLHRVGVNLMVGVNF
jgi:hypothetical protein